MQRTFEPAGALAKTRLHTCPAQMCAAHLPAFVGDACAQVPLKCGVPHLPFARKRQRKKTAAWPGHPSNRSNPWILACPAAISSKGQNAVPVKLTAYRDALTTSKF